MLIEQGQKSELTEVTSLIRAGTCWSPQKRPSAATWQSFGLLEFTANSSASTVLSKTLSPVS